MVLDGFCPIFSWKGRSALRPWACATSAVLATFVCGCGIAAAPQPPSLTLPKPVHDLAATRSGPSVALRWTTPHQTTDRATIAAPVRQRVCRQTQGALCVPVGTVTGQPGRPATFNDTLPAALARGPLRPLKYKVFAESPAGRDAGASNLATAAAGAVPAPLQALAATNTRRGVVLHWVPEPPNADVSIRLERTLVRTPASKPAAEARKAKAAPVPVLLQVPATANGQDPGQVLDTGTQFGSTYRYTGYRIVQNRALHPPLTAISPVSPPVEITPQDIFPPAAPTGLAAVPLASAINGGHPAVDLSWSPDTSADFAGYRVYRREILPAAQPEVRIAPRAGEQALLAPAYHDATVVSGAVYVYRVAAVNLAGVAGTRSAPVRAEVSAGNAAPTPIPPEQP